MATVSLTIRIDENDKKSIEQLAKEDDRSISYIVNQAKRIYKEKFKHKRGKTLISCLFIYQYILYYNYINTIYFDI